MSGKAGSHTTAAITALVLLSVIPLTASAQVRFNVPAEPLAQALEDLASQADLNVYYDRTVVAGLTAQALRADLTPKAAFARLLAGTRLAAVYVDQDTVRVVSKREARELRKEKEAASHPMADRGVTRPDSRPRREDPAEAGQSAGPPKDFAHSNGGRGSHKNALKEVIVTGSRLPTSSKYGPQEVQIYDRRQIDQSGQNSVSDFLTTLPTVSLSSYETAFGFYSTVRLRGLPAGTTLVLLNGRRLENSGITQGMFFDLNEIPLAAVKRIEVVPTGSSAIYGSDAIAGVVNIILKKNFNGVAADARYSWAKGFENVRTSIALGKQWHRGGISVIGSYGIDGGLLTNQRLLTASNDYTRFGGPDNNYAQCFPGDAFSINGAPLPGAPPGSGATYAAVTGSTSQGRPAFSEFTYGALNTCSALSGSSILPSRHREGILVQGHLQITSNIKLFSELMYAHVTQESLSGDVGLFGELGYQQFTVSAANPYNPFGETVGVTETFRGIPSAAQYDTDFFRPLVGVKGILARHWQWEVSAWQSRDWSNVTNTNSIPNYNAIQVALDSPNPTTALNPFVNGPAASPSVLRALFSNETYKEMGRDQSIEAYIRGPILRAPGGTIEAIVGGEYVRSTLYENLINNGVSPPNTRLNYHRRYDALFAEAKIPLIGHVRGASHNLMTLTVAVRRDNYTDFGSKTTDQLGLEMRPLQQLLLRGTYANAFDAPPLPVLYEADTTIPNEVIQDPVTKTSVQVPVVIGGNPNLRPITGHSYTVGLVYLSRLIPGMRLSATQWSITEANVIQNLSPEVLVNNETSFPGRVIRNSAGSIVEIIDTELNFGSIDADGIDYQIDYRRDLGRGKLSINLDATETYHYRQALTANAPSVESVSNATDDGNWSPRWKGTVGALWSYKALDFHVDGRYTGSYEDYIGLNIGSPRRVIGNTWIFDTNFRLALGGVLGKSNGWLGRSYVEMGVVNLFNRAPQFSNYQYDFIGYDASQMSIVGRSLYVGVGAHW